MVRMNFENEKKVNLFWMKDATVTHAEDPCGRGHFAVAALRVGQDAQVVAFAPAESGDVGLQFAAQRHQRVVGERHVLVALPHANLYTQTNQSIFVESTSVPFEDCVLVHAFQD